MQRYITYKRVQTGEFKYNDPNTDNVFEEATTDSIFNESPFKINDGRFICDVIYPDTTTQEQIDWLIAANLAFEFTFLTEEEANILLLEFWLDEGGIAFVSVKDFIYQDNRLLDLV